jgi:hypothetical protein
MASCFPQEIHAPAKKTFSVAALLLICAALFNANLRAQPAATAHPALSDATILIVRHAEKPEDGKELSPAGEKRAAAYPHYFKDFTVDSRPLKLDYLVATADSKGSNRPRLTLEPLSAALGLKMDQRFKAKDYEALAADLQSVARGKHILIAWHHGEIPELIQALGASPAALLPKGKWPNETFDWVIELRYDHEGRLVPSECRRINEHLMPGD